MAEGAQDRRPDDEGAREFDEAVERFIDSREIDRYRDRPDSLAESGELESLAEIGRIRSAYQSSPDPSPPRHEKSGGSPSLLDSDTHLSPFPLIPGYEITEEIGRGGFATIYRAHDPLTDRFVALKILDSKIKWSPSGLARFRREARSLAALRHENIVQIYHVIDTAGEAAAGTASMTRPGTLGLSMEFLDGETLGSKLERDGPFSPEAIIEIGQAICRALGEVHRAGYVHRDVKAENVMRDRDGRIVLMDFGVIRSLDRGTSVTGTGVMVGTPLTMAPEQYECRAVDARTDIWAVGCLLYRLATGSHAFDGDSIGKLRKRVTTGRFIPLLERRPDFPSELALRIERALSVAPGGRYATADEMEESLAERVEASTESTTIERRRVPPSVIVLLGAILAALLAVLVLLVMLLLRDG